MLGADGFCVDKLVDQFVGLVKCLAAEVVGGFEAGGLDQSSHRGDGVQDRRYFAAKQLFAEFRDASVGELGGALSADLVSPGNLGSGLTTVDNCVEGLTVSVGEC